MLANSNVNPETKGPFYDPNRDMTEDIIDTRLMPNLVSNMVSISLGTTTHGCCTGSLHDRATVSCPSILCLKVMVLIITTRMTFCQVVLNSGLINSVDDDLENKPAWWREGVERHKAENPEDPIPIPFRYAFAQFSPRLRCSTSTATPSRKLRRRSARSTPGTLRYI